MKAIIMTSPDLTTGIHMEKRLKLHHERLINKISSQVLLQRPAR